jgi:hypothetical protein
VGQGRCGMRLPIFVHLVWHKICTWSPSASIGDAFERGKYCLWETLFVYIYDVKSINKKKKKNYIYI